MSQSTLPHTTINVANNAELQANILAEITRVQAFDSLATVTLIVPNRQLSWALRRQLARSLEAGQALVNIRSLTQREFLTECARAYAIPTGIASEAVVRAAVIESTLQSDSTLGVSVSHPETASRLARLLTELEWCDLSEVALERISGSASPTAAAAISFSHRARLTLHEQLQEVDLVTLAQEITAATHMTDTTPALVRAFGSIVVVNQLLPAPVASVLQVISAPVTHIAIEMPGRPSITSDTRIHSTPDPESEAIIAARFVMEALAEGISAEQIAVVFSVDQPYAGLLKRSLDEAKIAWHGSEPGSLRESILTRRAYSLLEMATAHSQGQGIRRPSLMKWLALNPEKSSDAAASASQLRNLIRSEGLFGKADTWIDALKEISRQAQELKSLDIDELDSKTRRRLKLGPAADTLIETIKDLETELTKVNNSKNWAEIAPAFHEVFERYSPATRKSTSQLDSSVRELVETLCQNSLPSIDSILTDTRSRHLLPSAATFQALLEKEVDSRSASHGDQSVGVHVGSIASTRCLTFERVIILGAADGLLPSIRGNNPLFTDPIRLLLRDSVADAPTIAENEREVSTLVHALVNSSSHTRILYPRGAIPTGGVGKPSRYFADLAVTEHDQNFDFLSFESAFELGPRPATSRDLAVRSGMSETTQNGELLRRYEAIQAWARPSFNSYFGNIGEQELTWQISEKPLSASTIEKYIYCPYHFFVEKILGFSTDDFDDEPDEISQRDIGLMLHSALENLVNQASSEGWLPGPGQPWPEIAITQLTNLFAAEAERASSVGLTGWAPVWQAKYAEIVESLKEFLVVDNELRAEPKMSPGTAEFAFGESDSNRVSLTTENKTKVQLRGSIDRLDIAPEGDEAHVIDYKSGNPERFAPAIKGKTLGPFRDKIQDLVYSVAVTHLNTAVKKTRVSFVFVPGKDGVEVINSSSELDPVLELTEIVNHLENAANTGSFPPIYRGDRSYCPVCKQLGSRAMRVKTHFNTTSNSDSEEKNIGEIA